MMTPLDELKQALKPGDQSRIARELDLSPSVVNMVLHGQYPRPRTAKSARTVQRVQTKLAAVIGRSVDEVFSDAATIAA
jgi:predicted transcriptional regulator